MKRRIVLIFVLILVFYSIFGTLAFLSIKKALKETTLAVNTAKLQDLDGTKAHLKDAQNSFKSSKKFLLVFTPLRVIPVLGWYVADVQRGVEAAQDGLAAAKIFAEAITPYADVLGLKGKGTFLGGTAQERLAEAIGALSKVTPQIDEVGKNLESARSRSEEHTSEL